MARPYRAPTRKGRYFAATAFFGRWITPLMADGGESWEPERFRWYTREQAERLRDTHIWFANRRGDVGRLLERSGEIQVSLSLLIHESLLDEARRFRGER